MRSPGVGIIGSGWGARVQIPAFRAAGLEVVALAGSQAQKTQQIATELGVPYATGNWRQLLEQESVHLVSVVTPPALHCEMSIAALQAGKHVLCEKPTALNVTEAIQMYEVARQLPDQIALIDHEMRFLPAIQEARRLVGEGYIGQLRHGEVRFISNSRANLNRAWNWWSDAEQGGGILGAIGSHMIDIIRYIMDDAIIAVSGTLATFIKERPVSTDASGQASQVRAVTSDDFAAFTLKLARGGIVHCIASMVARRNESQSITLYGDAGSLRFIEGTLLYAAPDEGFRDVTPTSPFVVPEHIIRLYPDYAEATVFLGVALREAISGNTQAIAPAATFLDGVHTQSVIDAVRASHQQQQQWVPIPAAPVRAEAR